jgi:hypothetical protein
MNVKATEVRRISKNILRKNMHYSEVNLHSHF